MTSPGSDAVLALENSVVRFPGVPATVVDGIGFSVRRGRTLAIVGESGCGKSVTSLPLMGLLPQTARITGSARFCGADSPDLLAMPERARADLRGNRIAMVFQEPMTSLNPAFTIGDQIGEAVARHKGPNRLVVESRLPEATIAELRRRGHDIEVEDPWSEGRRVAAALDGPFRRAAANPRGMQGYAAGR